MEVRTRSTLIAVGGIVVVAAGAVVAWQLLSKDDGPSTDPGAARITLVASVGGEERIEGAVADRVRQVIRSRTPSKRAFDDREFGVYRPANSQLPSYVVIAGSAHDDPTVYNDVHDRDPETVVSTMLTQGGAVIGSQVRTMAPLDGVMHCGKTQQGSTSLPVCAWAGHSTVGLVLGLQQSETSDEAAQFTLALRRASEH